MTKIVKRTSIVLMIIIISLLTLSTKTFGYYEYREYTSDELQGKDNNYIPNWNGTGFIDLREADKVEVWPGNGNGTEGDGTDRGQALRYVPDSSTQAMRCSILSAPNIYCAQHGVNLGDGGWTVILAVSKEYEVKDPMLAYILAQTPDISDMATHPDYDCYKIGYEYNPIQLALWKYVYDAMNTSNTNVAMTEDLKIILGDDANLVEDPSKNTLYNTPLHIGNIYDSAANIYAKAKLYKNQFENGTNTEVYAAWYRVLYKTGQQRIVAVTKMNTTIVSADVSLQKYITQVNHADGTTTFVNGRSNTYRTSTSSDRTTVSKSNEKFMKLFFKKENPVQIKAGDIVQYAIMLYNNGNTNVKVKFTDMLPLGATEYQVGASGWVKLSSSAQSNAWYTSDEINVYANSTALKYVYVKFGDYQAQVLENSAWISYTDKTNRTKYRTSDADYVQMEKGYRVSLEKYISAVNGVSTGFEDRRGKAEYLTTQYEDTTQNDTQWTQKNWYKMNHLVNVKNGDYVTYTITVRNDGEEPIFISEIEDTLPEGISGYIVGGYSVGETYLSVPTSGKISIIRTGRTLLKQGESTSVMITVRVNASNLSSTIFKNTAKITGIRKENEDQVLNADQYDATPFNNEDSDYFTMDDIAIAGMVWQDDALNKQQNNYNGVYDADKEKKLSGVKVALYRITETGTKLVATTYTDQNGNYEFTRDSKVSPNSTETLGPIKGLNANYYVVFEYDGMTYTSTTYTTVMSQNDFPLTSNAREKLNNTESFDGQVNIGRTEFNNRYATIHQNSGIRYETKNEAGYIPQSLHLSNDSMMMQSSTEHIRISESTVTEAQLLHVNLGLRGRDVFDLELAADVYATKVTVNGVDGVYQYNNNKLTIRKSDIMVAEDTANVAQETRESTVTQVNQDVRKTDIQNTKYSNTGLQIEVTYKMTVKNASLTEGFASAITDYFDSQYSLKRAYYLDETHPLKTTNGASGRGYKSARIELPDVYLKEGETIDIYVVFNLENASDVLKGLVAEGAENNLPIFNLAEIEEYKTRVAESKNQTEFTRGLIDIDSAPGSANKEEARLYTNTGKNTPTINGNPTTVGYYFDAAMRYINNRNDTRINDLKYEDDTATAPILYFAASDNQRKITGTVFRDNTTYHQETKIKTGNGRLDAGEVGVYGATVELVEQVNGGIVRATATTDQNGNYTLEDILPGNYQIRYQYGDTINTVLLNQFEEGEVKVNKISFNGADYQSTNNTGTHGAAKLSDVPNYWYLYNERDGGISTATDVAARRQRVDQNAASFTSAENTLLNDIRAGRVTATNDQVRNLIEKTKMEAITPRFIISVEAAYLDANGNRIERAEFGEYTVTHMNFGLAGLPTTMMNLEKHVEELTITDSTGSNVIAKIVRKEDGNWSVEAGNIIAVEGERPQIDVQIEDNKLQGAMLKVKYTFTSEVIEEFDFQGEANATPIQITGLVDFIDNDLIYNPDLDNNKQYWEITKYADIFGGDNSLGTVDPDGVLYNVVIKATPENPLLKDDSSEVATLTLEKQLSSIDSTFEDIVTSTVDIYVYDNIVEITGMTGKKVETTGGNIIIPGVQNDTASAEIITIHPPTGDSGIQTMYLVLGAISLIILAGGAFCIKKFVLTK